MRLGQDTDLTLRIIHPEMEIWLEREIFMRFMVNHSFKSFLETSSKRSTQVKTKRSQRMISLSSISLISWWELRLLLNQKNMMRLL